MGVKKNMKKVEKNGEQKVRGKKLEQKKNIRKVGTKVGVKRKLPLSS